jgi:CDP-paratose 2-epimerase
VEDLIDAYQSFLGSDRRHGVWNMGGGPRFTLSLLELLELLRGRTGVAPNVTFSDWRPSDQKVYISNISKAEKELSWSPNVSPEEGVGRLVDWVSAHRDLFR